MLTPAQRTFLTNEQIIAPAVFNLLLNMGIGWLAFHKHQPVPLWGDPSLAGDIIGTLFLLPFFTCLFVTGAVRRAASKGKVARLTITPREHPLLRLLPRSLWGRAALVGLACVIVLGPPSVGALALVGVKQLSLGAAIPFKGVYAAILAALVTPLFALYALAHEEPKA